MNKTEITYIKILTCTGGLEKRGEEPRREWPSK
jgi:hypothetical protein